MAQNNSRSMKDSLREGATDGTFKKLVTNRDGVVDPLTTQARTQLPPYCNLTEAVYKEPPVPID